MKTCKERINKALLRLHVIGAKLEQFSDECKEELIEAAPGEEKAEALEKAVTEYQEVIGCIEEAISHLEEAIGERSS